MAHRSDRHGGAVKRRAGVPAATPASTEPARDAATDERAHPLAKWWAYAAAMRALKVWDAMATWKRYAWITLVVVGPYVAWVCYLWFHLQSGLLRPRVAVDHPRPVLIVGTQSSGTTQMSHQLARIGLEVGHETSDATWDFARDGTISWLHGMRFMPGRAPPATIAQLCRRFRRNMGLHPAQFRAPALGCSYRSTWDKCWSAECAGIVTREWGCAARGTCETPFDVALLQLRHPLRTMESLAAKFCPPDDDLAGAFKPPHVDFLETAAALWPERHDWNTSGCVDAVGWYVALYTRDMLAARDAGFIAEAYRVEDTYPCEVASRAGLLLTNARARGRCETVMRKRKEGFNGGVDGQARRATVTTVTTAKGKNVRNENGRVRFEARDVVSGELRALIADVAARGGYRYDDDEEP